MSPGSTVVRQHAGARYPGFHELRVLDVVRETADASSFLLDVPPQLADAFRYEAGQFLTFRVHIDGTAHFRSYSMSSSPVVDPYLRVTVKRVPGGLVSNWLNDRLVPGSLTEVSRPAGRFCLGDATGEVVAFGAGSGITPVMSIVKTVLAATGRRVRLLYANRDAASVIFAAELDALSRRYEDRFLLVHHLDSECGFVEPDDIGPWVSRDRDAEYFVCGPDPFMEVVEQALLDRGVDREHIRIERFTPTQPTPAPDIHRSGTRITIELNGRQATADHRPGTTVLQMARQLGLSPPSSCEAGDCATCIGRLVAGTATMRANNALTAEEVEAGWILTCQAEPASPDVHVVYGYE